MHKRAHARTCASGSASAPTEIMRATAPHALSRTCRRECCKATAVTDGMPSRIARSGGEPGGRSFAEVGIGRRPGPAGAHSLLDRGFEQRLESDQHVGEVRLDYMLSARKRSLHP